MLFQYSLGIDLRFCYYYYGDDYIIIIVGIEIGPIIYTSMISTVVAIMIYVIACFRIIFVVLAMFMMEIWITTN